MLKIRLERVVRNNDPSYRVGVVDARRAARSGKAIEILGNYDARKGAPVIAGERVRHWLSKGAHASPTVHNLLVKQGVVSGKKIHVSRLRAKEKKGKVS